MLLRSLTDPKVDTNKIPNQYYINSPRPRINTYTNNIYMRLTDINNIITVFNTL